MDVVVIPSNSMEMANIRQATEKTKNAVSVVGCWPKGQKLLMTASMDSPYAFNAFFLGAHEHFGYYVHFFI